MNNKGKKIRREEAKAVMRLMKEIEKEMEREREKSVEIERVQ